MRKFVTKDAEIERLENQLTPAGQQEDMGLLAIDGPAPEWMDPADAGLGTEHITQVEIPRLELLYGTSQLVKDGRARAGQFYHTGADEVLDAPIDFVPCNSTETAILWGPYGSGLGMLAKSTDMVHWDPSHATFEVPIDRKTVKWETKGTIEESGLLKWGSRDPENPEGGYFAGTAYVNILAYFPQYPSLGPAVISCFKRSGYKVGRNLNGQLITLRNRGKAAFAGKFQLSTRTKVGRAGSYIVPHYTLRGWSSAEEYRIAKQIFRDSNGWDLGRAAESDARDDESAVPDGHEDAGVRY